MKFSEVLYSTILVIIVAGMAMVLGFMLNKSKNFGQGENFNLIDTTTQSTTSTATLLPVKVLARNYNRIYGLIVNDSDTVMYLSLNNFTDASAASTTVFGIRLNANGGSYEVMPSNNYIGDVWATSTASNKKLLITEK